MPRIIATIHSDNLRSKRVVEKVGMVDVGTIEHKEFKDVPFRLYEIFSELHTKAENE